MIDLTAIVARFEKSPVRPYCEQMLMAALFLRLESLRYQQLRVSLVSAFGEDGEPVEATLREAPYQFAEHGFFEDVCEVKTVRALWDALVGVTVGGAPIVHYTLKLEDRVERLMNDELPSILGDVAGLDLSACLTEPRLLGQSYDAALGAIRRPSRALSATPPELADLMARLLAPQAGEKVYDPACGCGECLLAMDRASVGEAKVYGQDFNASFSAFAELRLRFYGYTSAEIHHGNTLRDPRCEGPFQVLVTEPPFGTFREDNEGSLARFEDKFVRHLLLEGRMDSKDGRAAVVVPYNFLYNRTLSNLRKSLVGQNLLDAVIRLPRNLLFGSSVQTYLLVFRANRGEKKEVCFIDASRRDFSERAVGRNVLTASAIEQITKAYLSGEEQSGFIWRDSIENCVSDGGYSFDDPRFPSYKAQSKKHLGVVEIEKQIRVLTDELASLTALRGW